MEEEISLLDVLLDPDNKDNIILKATDGTEMEFEQLAVIPHEDVLYVVMRPVTPIDGVAEDECIIFKVVEEDTTRMMVEDDEDKAQEIYDEYLKLFEEEQD